ncbi:hypothetical protein GJ496_011158 [Pomphorhynchus laevis]|nr:hypothetical protein GJ496_011158 [Pomphorhynchus laevis]
MYIQIRELKRLLSNPEDIDYLDIIKAISASKEVLINPLRHSGPSDTSLRYLDRAQFEPVVIEGNDGVAQTMPKDFLHDALAISRTLQLDEKISLELVYHGFLQQAFYPELTRGLVAVLLFYDCKLSILECLFHLSTIESKRDCHSDLLAVVNSVLTSTLFANILSEIDNFKWASEYQRLSSINGVGSDRHSHEIRWRIHKIRNCCGRLFQMVAFKLTRSDIERLLILLSNGKLQECINDADEFSINKQCCSGDEFLNCLCNSILNIIEQWFTKDYIDDKLFGNIKLLCDHIRSETAWVSMDMRALIKLSLYVHIRWATSFNDNADALATLEASYDVAIEDAVEHFAFRCICSMCTDYHDCALAWSDTLYSYSEDVHTFHNILSKFVTLMPGYIEELRCRAIRGDNQSSYQNLIDSFSSIYENDGSLTRTMWTVNDDIVTDSSLWNIRKCFVTSCDILSPDLVPSVLKLLKTLSMNTEGALQTFSIITRFSSTDDHFLSIKKIFQALSLYCKSYSSLDIQNDTNSTALPPSTSHNIKSEEYLPKIAINPNEHDALVFALDTLGTLASNNEYVSHKLLSGMFQTDIVQILSNIITLPMPVMLKAASFNVLSALLKHNPDILRTKIHTIVKCCLQNEGLKLEIENCEKVSSKYPLFRSVLMLLTSVLRCSDFDDSALLTHIIDFICNYAIKQLSSFRFHNQREEYLTVIAVVQSTYFLIKSIMSYHTYGGKELIHLRKEGLNLLYTLGQYNGPLSIILQFGVNFTQRLCKFVPIQDAKNLSNSFQRIFEFLHISLTYQDAVLSTIRETSSLSKMVFPIHELLLRIHSNEKYPKYFFMLLRFLQFFNDFPSQCRKILDCLTIIFNKMESDMMTFLCRFEEDIDIVKESFIRIIDSKSSDNDEIDIHSIDEAYCRRKVLALIHSSLKDNNKLFAYFLLNAKTLDDRNYSMTIESSDSNFQSRSAFHIIGKALDRSLVDDVFFNLHGGTCVLCAKIILLLTNSDTALSQFTTNFVRSIDTSLVNYIAQPNIIINGNNEHLSFISCVTRLLAVDLLTSKQCGLDDRIFNFKNILTQNMSGVDDFAGRALLSDLLWQLNCKSRDVISIAEEHCALDPHNFSLFKHIIDSCPSTKEQFVWNNQTFQIELLDVDFLIKKIQASTKSKMLESSKDYFADHVQKNMAQTINFAHLHNMEQECIHRCNEFVCAWTELIQVMESVFSAAIWTYSNRSQVLSEFIAMLKAIDQSGCLSIGECMLPFSIALCFLSFGLRQSFLALKYDLCNLHCLSASVPEWYAILNDSWQMLCHLLTICVYDGARGFLYSAMVAVIQNVEDLCLLCNDEDLKEIDNVVRTKPLLSLNNRMTLALSRNIEKEDDVNQSLSISLISVLISHNTDYLSQLVGLGCIDQLIDGVFNDAKEVNRICSDDQFFFLFKAKLNLLLNCAIRSSDKNLQFTKLLSLTILNDMLPLLNRASVPYVLTSSGLNTANIGDKFSSLFKLLMHIFIFCLEKYENDSRIDVKIQITNWLSLHEQVIEMVLQEFGIEKESTIASISLAINVVSVLVHIGELFNDKGFSRICRSLSEKSLHSDLLNYNSIESAFSKFQESTKYKNIATLLRASSLIISCTSLRILSQANGFIDRLIGFARCLLTSQIVRKYEQLQANKYLESSSLLSSKYVQTTKNLKELQDFEYKLKYHRCSRNAVKDIAIWSNQIVEQIVTLVWLHIEDKLSVIEPGLIGRLTSLHPSTLSDQTFQHYSQLLKNIIPLSINQEFCTLLLKPKEQTLTKTISDDFSFLYLMSFKLGRLCLFICPNVKSNNV